MADDLQDLIVEQSAVVASIKRVLVNFKKMGKANVTQYRAKIRLDHLETLWEKCQRLNIWLLQVATTEEQCTVAYFTKEEFFAAEDVYHETADYLADTIGKLSHGISDAAASVSDVSLREHSAVSLQLPRIVTEILRRFRGMGKFSWNLRISCRVEGLAVEYAKITLFKSQCHR